MMRHKHGYDHRCQLHASPEDRGAASMFDRFNNFFFFYFILTKKKIVMELNDNNKKNYYEITTKP